MSEFFMEMSSLSLHFATSLRLPMHTQVTQIQCTPVALNLRLSRLYMWVTNLIRVSVIPHLYKLRLREDGKMDCLTAAQICGQVVVVCLYFQEYG